MTKQSFTLVSHHLCPYVQRVAIAFIEKGIDFDRIFIDLANKPDWFLALSPLGKTPVLRVGPHAVLESSVILEYLEDTQPNALHPAEPFARAEHRAWVEFASAVLSDIAGFYTASDVATFESRTTELTRKFDHVERRLGAGPYFEGARFSLVDAAFGPVFRYFDVFDRIGDFGVLSGRPKVADWRANLAARDSIRCSVTEDYEARLWHFLEARKAHVSRLMPADAAAQCGGLVSARGQIHASSSCVHHAS